MKTLNILLFVIIVIPLYSQEDSLKYSDFSCSCIKSLPNKTMPDSFKLGLKYPNPGAYYGYEYFSIAETSLVKFKVSDINPKIVTQTEFYLLLQGNYQLTWINLLKPIEDIKSGVYYLEMTVISPKNYKQVFKGDKRVLLVK